MNTDFPTLVGRFIHHCGAIEFLVNNSIRAFSSDPLLSTEAVKSPLYKRIVLLRKLLKERSSVKHDEIDSLCKELDEMRNRRNIVAHNPIVSSAPDESGTQEILVFRYRPTEVTIPDKLTMKDVSELVKKSRHLMVRFATLIPESTET